MNICSSVTGIAITATVASAAAADIDIATWVWEPETYRMLDDTDYRRQSLDFAQRHGFTTFYLYADQYHQNDVQDYRHCDEKSGPCPPNRNILIDEPDKYRSLIADIHDRGMKVHALIGSGFLDSKQWHRPEFRGQALTAVDNILAYNAAARSAQLRFDGINTDLEPYVENADWTLTSPLDSIVDQARLWLDTQAQIIARRNDARDRGDAGADIPVGISQAFWTDRDSHTVTVKDDVTEIEGVPAFEWNGVTKPLNEHLQDLHDYATILDYRDTANGRVKNPDGDSAEKDNGNGIIAHGRAEAFYAESTDKPFYIAVNTTPSEKHPETTFIEEGAVDMQRELAAARAYFQANTPNTFAGLAIHDFIDYQRLVQLHWTDSADGDWDSSEHWGIFEHHKNWEDRPSTNTPLELDDILIQPRDGATVTGPSTDQTVYWMTIGAKSSGTADLNLRGHELTVTQGITLEERGRLSGSGVVHADITLQPGASVHVLDGDAITITGDVSGPGRFTGDGHVILSGSLSPGNSPDVISFEGRVEFTQDHVLMLQLAGTSPDLYDQLDVEGDAVLGGSLLIELLDGFVPDLGDEFMILDVTGDLIGQFNDLADGSSVAKFFGVDLRISYTGGDGNDVVLTAVPEPNVWSLLALGGICLLRFRGPAVESQADCLLKLFHASSGR